MPKIKAPYHRFVAILNMWQLQRIKGLQSPAIIVISFLYLNYKIPPPTLLSAIVY